MRNFGKRGFADYMWRVIVVLIVTLIAFVIFYVIFKQRIGGLLHL